MTNTDRFDEMAQAFCIEHNLAVDDALAALLRKGYETQAAMSALLVTSECVLTIGEMSELLTSRKVVEAAREYRDECDQKCACVFTARLLEALDAPGSS